MIDQKILDEMMRESTKDEAMIPRTLRLPPDLDKEVRAYCDSNQGRIKWAVLARKCFEIGWRQLTSTGGEAQDQTSSSGENQLAPEVRGVYEGARGTGDVPPVDRP